MKKTICLLLIMIMLVLSGCGQPLKKLVPKQNDSNTTEDANQQNNGQTAPDAANPETKTGSSKTKVSADNLKGSGTKASGPSVSSDIVMENNVPTIKNPGTILVLVNKTRNLAPDYVPDDLTVPNVKFSFEGSSPKKNMRQEAARALEGLFNEAKKENIDLTAVSGYRSYSTQKALFNNEVKRYGEAAAKKSVAYPGQSEHQTGLSIDVSSPSINNTLSESFGETKEGKWLKENAKSFGFIIRYPKDKVNITGYSYEPWHIRYVGKDAAAYISSSNITLDEYIQKVAKN